MSLVFQTPREYVNVFGHVWIPNIEAQPSRDSFIHFQLVQLEADPCTCRTCPEARNVSVMGILVSVVIGIYNICPMIFCQMTQARIIARVSSRYF